MANPNETNPKLYTADAEQSGPHSPEDKIYHLTRSPPEATSGAGEAAKLEWKARPDDRKPEARPSDEPPRVPAASDSVTSKKSLLRPLLYTLLPLVLIVGGCLCAGRYGGIVNRCIRDRHRSVGS
jgi:membrane fusion protein (multidrug efflux system)